MICNSKTEFLTSLRVALENNGINDRTDILNDFRQHFEDGAAAGESEADVCRKLGDIDDIIKQYITEEAEQKASEPDMSGFGADSANTVPPQYGNVQQPQQEGFHADGGKITGLIFLDILIYSWTLPALASLIISLIGMAIGFVTGGITLMIGGAFSSVIDMSGFISTGFVPISIVFLGITLAALGGMLVIASINSVKGFINICIAVVNQHSRTFSGKNIAKKIGKKYREADVQ